MSIIPQTADRPQGPLGAVPPPTADGPTADGQSAGTDDRRQFLRRCGAAATVLGVWSEQAAAAPRSAGETLNIAAVGVGNHGHSNVLGVGSQNIVALCDVDERYLAESRERLPRAAVYHDFRKMLDERRDLDAVVVSSPDHTHALAAVLAMRSGLHVYCEKPLAHSIQETRLMARTARERRVVTQTGMQHHGSLGYRRVAELVRGGALGAVREVHSWTVRPSWPQGVGRPAAAARTPDYLHWDEWLGPAPARPYAEGYHPFAWRAFWDFGTGAIGDRGPHLLDPAFAALELGAPTSVEAESSQAESSQARDETAPAWSVIRFQFPARPPRPAVKLVWYDGGKQPPLELAGVRRWPHDGTLLIGDKARLYIPPLGDRPLLIGLDSAAPIDEPPSSLAPAPNHYEEWIAACKGGPAPSCDFQYGARVTETCLLGNVALRSGRRLEWSDAEARVTNAPEANRFLGRDYRPGWDPK